GPDLPLVGTLGLAGGQIKHPVVQRAGDRGAMHDALAQWSVLVRTAVLNGEYLVVLRAEHRNSSSGSIDAARAAPGNGVDSADLDPVCHGSSYSAATGKPNSAMAANSWASLPLTRSSQGSIWAKVCEKTKRS